MSGLPRWTTAPAHRESIGPSSPLSALLELTLAFEIIDRDKNRTHLVERIPSSTYTYLRRLYGVQSLCLIEENGNKWENRVSSLLTRMIDCYRFILCSSLQS